MLFWTNYDKIPITSDDLFYLEDDFVYKKIWESLSDKDRQLVRAVGSRQASVSDITTQMSISQTSFPRYKERLIKKGILHVPSRGLVELSLPRFAEVVRFYP